MPALITPTTDLHSEWLEAHADWGPGLHEDGFGLSADDEVESADGFAAWVSRLVRSEHGTCLWIVEGRQVLGGIALRHQLNPRSGHVGYGIRPSARGRGLATWALGEVLGLARDRELERLLLVCEAGNVASARTIERHGGVLEDAGAGVRRYWIELG